IDPPMIAGVARLRDDSAGSPPWSRLAAALSAQQPTAVRRAVATLAERGAGGAPASVPYVLHGVAEGRGAVAAFQVAAATWLVVLFPGAPSPLPLLPLLLSAVVLAAVLVGFERTRRRAERAQ